MKKNYIILIAIALSAILMTGCGKTIAKEFGGDLTINLDPNQKLEEITWKDTSLWYLTRPMREDEEAETHVFQADTNWGVFEGTVTIVESKCDEEILLEFKEWQSLSNISYDDYIWCKEHGYTFSDWNDGDIDWDLYNQNTGNILDRRIP